MWAGYVDWALTRHFLSVIISPSTSSSKLQPHLHHAPQAPLTGSHHESSQLNPNQLSSIRAIPVSRGAEVHLYPGERRGGWGSVLTLNSPLLSICVTEQRTALTATMKMPDSAPQLGDLLWRKLPVSWSLFWPLTAPTTWRNYLVPKPGITCNNWEESTLWPSLSQVGVLHLQTQFWHLPYL